MEKDIHASGKKSHKLQEILNQIWFTEKDEFGNTTVFFLAEIKGIRNTVPYDKWYDKWGVEYGDMSADKGKAR